MYDSYKKPWFAYLFYFQLLIDYIHSPNENYTAGLVFLGKVITLND